MAAWAIGMFVPESHAKPSHGTATIDRTDRAALNVEDWPQGVTSFVRVQKAGMPIFKKPAYSRRNLIRTALAGEILQYHDKRMILTFSNPFGKAPGGNGTWYRVSLLTGTEGWIFPSEQHPVLDFSAARVQPEKIGIGGKRIEKTVFRFAEPTVLSGSRGETLLASRKGGYWYVYRDDPQSVSLGNLKGSLGTWNKSDLSGWVETIPWYTEWDEIMRRQLPPLLWVLSPILFLSLSIATIYNDPEHEKKKGRAVIALLWFGITALGMMMTAFGKKIENSLETAIEFHRYDTLSDFVLLGLLLPYLAEVAFFHEGFVTAVIRMRYFFSQTSVGEVMNERARQKEHKVKQKDLAEKEEAIAQQEAKVQSRLATLRHGIPEIMHVEPAPVMDYEGYWGEVEKRFQQRQMLKTAKVARERLEEVRKLCEEGARLQRARADLEIAKVDWESVDDDIRIKKKERILKEKLVDRDILQTEQEMKMLKGAFHKKKREDFEL